LVNNNLVIWNWLWLATKTGVKIEKIEDSTKIVVVRHYINSNLTQFMRKLEMEVSESSYYFIV
jgi:hypothetical protein